MKDKAKNINTSMTQEWWQEFKESNRAIGESQPLNVDAINIASPLHSEPVNVAIAEKYLTKQALQILTTPVYNTVVEEEVVDWRKSMSVEGLVYTRRSHHVQFLELLCDAELTEERIKNFCYLINQIVQNGDFIIGTLCPPHTLHLEDGRSILFCFVASPTSQQDLWARYGPVFCEEGQLPTIHVDELEDREWKLHWKEYTRLKDQFIASLIGQGDDSNLSEHAASAMAHYVITHGEHKSATEEESQ